MPPAQNFRKSRVGLFIDGPNLYATARALDLDIDYRRLLDYFKERYDLLRAFYYTALIGDQDFSPIRPLLDWLQYNGFSVVTKPAREFSDDSGRRKVRSDILVELVVDALELAPHLDRMILFSGNGDFRRLVDFVQRRGVRVAVVSTLHSQPPIASDELRRTADEFIDLNDLRKFIGRGEDYPPNDHFDDEQEGDTVHEEEDEDEDEEKEDY